jgi:tetratricopeptide (TPR) repeat protein
MSRCKLVCLLGLVQVVFVGCARESAPDSVDAGELVAATALVLNDWHPGIGFLIDKEEKLLLTTNRTVGRREEIAITFPIITDGKALVRKSAWLARLDRTVKGKIIIADPERDLAVLRLESVAADVPALKLAKGGPKQSDAVQFLGAGAKGMAGALATSTIQRIESREVPLGDNKQAKNQMIALEAVGELAKEVAGGALLNENAEVVGVVTSDPAQTGALLCTDLSEVRPVVAAAYRSIAMQADAAGKYDAALMYSDRALTVWPEDALGYNERGAAYSQKDQFDKAVADYSKALELEPKLALAFRNRGSAYVHLTKYKEAIADCTQALALAPNYVSVYSIRSEAYRKLGMTKEADADSLAAGLGKPGWKSTFMDPNIVFDASGQRYERGFDGYFHGSNGRRYIKTHTPRPGSFPVKPLTR